MQFRYLTLLALPALISAFPQAASDAKECNDKCLSERFCIQSYPESCYCAHRHAVECAEICKLVPGPPREPKCEDKPEVGGDVDVCRRECEGKVMCTQQWPQSCHCANRTKEMCAKECGGEVKEGELQVCDLKDVRA